MLDDVAILEEHSLGNLSPLRLAAEKELEVHAEVLELLADGICHHAPRFRIALDRQALLIPADRFRLLCQRRAKPCERARLLRELLRRLVVLVEAHLFLLGDVVSWKLSASIYPGSCHSATQKLDGS